MEEKELLKRQARDPEEEERNEQEQRGSLVATERRPSRMVSSLNSSRGLVDEDDRPLGG